MLSQVWIATALWSSTAGRQRLGGAVQQLFSDGNAFSWKAPARPLRTSRPPPLPLEAPE